jgi:hypothetical protein
VHLVDQQESQLSQGLDYVQQLRSSSSATSTNWGKITTSKQNSLKEELEKAWLAIEVRRINNFAMNYSSLSACLLVVRAGEFEIETERDKPAR